MAKLISDLQTKLARRLGSNTAPTDTNELAKRRDWFWEAINIVCSEDEYFWFMKKQVTDTVIENKPYYDIPTRFRQPIEIKIDGNIYTRTTKEAYDNETINSVVSLPSVSLEYEYYIYNDHLYFFPIPSAAPDAVTITLTQTTGTATATSASAHGFVAGDFLTVSGADQTGYNGTIEVLTVPTTTTFTYAVASSTTSPATGTITATLRNINIWYWEDVTEPTSESSGIVLPDKYDYIPVAYAEGRYWSSAHKRGKAADGFTEFESGLYKIKQENFRRKFGQNEETGILLS